MPNGVIHTHYGYMGKILDVDLSSGRITQKPVDSDVALWFIGGSGFGIRMLIGMDADMDPLGPRNAIMLATGPLTGTPVPTSSRLEVSTISPLTGHLGIANVGGYFGPALRRAGFDAVVIRGKAEEPVYLWIDGGRAEIRDASHLWGRYDIWEFEEVIKQDLGEDVKALSIGPAGENLVRYATLTTDKVHTAARCGVGTVFGSKNLKAVVARGSAKVPVARPEEFLERVREVGRWILEDDGLEPTVRWGTLPRLRPALEFGYLPGRNFQTGYFPNFDETRGFAAARKYIAPSIAPCHACPIRCYNHIRVKEGPYAGLDLLGGYTTILSEFAAKCDIGNLPAVWKCEELSQRYGLDCISVASCIAFAQELYQRGIITKTDTDGLELRWGNERAVMELLRKIAYREGFGDVLADGVIRAAARLGRGSEAYAYTIKGMEISSCDPRSGPWFWRIGYITSPRGGDNVKTTHRGEGAPSAAEIKEKYGISEDEYHKRFVDRIDMPSAVKEKVYGNPPRISADKLEGKVHMTKWFEELSALQDALGVCKFGNSRVNLGATHYSRLLSALTGVDRSPEELLLVGERIFNLQRVFLGWRGFSRKDDNWPERFYREPLPEGPGKGLVLSHDVIDRILDEYYELRGWDKITGLPTEDKLKELGLDKEMSVWP